MKFQYYMPMTIDLKLFHLIIRVSKRESAMLYFHLEALEGLCFFFTVDTMRQSVYRDIDVKGTIEFKNDVFSFINDYRKDFPQLEILKNTVIDDEEPLFKDRKLWKN
jgi:hypothetical protein